MLNELESKLAANFEKVDGLYVNPTSTGYWSNLKKEEQTDLLDALHDRNCHDVIAEKFPQFSDIIFNPVRAAGLKMLDVKTDDIGIDYGCMWGNLLIYAAKNCKTMVGIDKTAESLRFLQHRLREEKLDNCYLLNSDLRQLIDFDDVFDFAIINGVLEWLPDENDVELPKFFSKERCGFKRPSRNPKLVQFEFLQKVYRDLKKGGKLYLAIENRYDYQYFLWKKDPHPGLYYTAFLPRWIANIISNIWYGRPYTTYIYSSKKLQKMLEKAGFARIEKYSTFPDYRFPLKIIPMGNDIKNSYSPIYITSHTNNLVKRAFRVIRRKLDLLIYKKLQLMSLAPSFIFIAEK